MIRRVAAGIGMTAFDKLVVAGTQLALVPILATRWGLELYGQWLLLATLPQFLSMSDLGFATAAGTRMTMAAARGDRAEALRIFQSAWRAILASSAVVLATLFAAVWLLPDVLFAHSPAASVGEARLTLLILIAYGVLAVQGSIVFAGFRAAQQFPVGAFWNAMVLLIENAALIATVWLGGGMAAAACAWLIGRSLGLIGQQLLLRARVPWLRLGLGHGSWSEARALMKPAGAVMLMPLAQALVLQGTAVMVGLAGGQALVPVFTAARTLSRVGLQLCWIVSTPLMPEFSAAVARRDRPGMATMLLVLLGVSALLVVPYGLGFMTLGAPMIALWTHGAIEAPLGLIVGMGLTIVFGGLWYPVSNLILACDRPAAYTRPYVLLAALNLPLAFLATRLVGVAGAGLAMALLDGGMLVVVTRIARRSLADGAALRAALARSLARTRWRRLTR